MTWLQVLAFPKIYLRIRPVISLVNRAWLLGALYWERFATSPLDGRAGRIEKSLPTAMVDPDKRDKIAISGDYLFGEYFSLRSPCSPPHVFGTWADTGKQHHRAATTASEFKDRQSSRQTKALTNRQLRLRQKWIGVQRLNNALACFSIFSHHDFSSGLLLEISASNWKLDNSIRRQLPS